MKTKLTSLKTLLVVLATAISGFAAAQCQASFTYAFSGPNVVFTNTSSASMPFYNWNFGDSQTSYQANPTHAYNATGMYMVCLTLWDSLNNCQSSFCDTVVVTSACGMTVTPSVTNESNCGSCDGSVTLAVSGGQAPYTYLWSNSATTASLSNLCHSYYSVDVTDANGCVVTAGFNVTCPQQTSCAAGFTYSVNGPIVTFTNTSTGSSMPIYSWNFGDNTYSSQTNPVHSYNSAGTYPVTLFLYDSLSGCQSIYYDSIVVASGCGMTATMFTNNASNCSLCDGSAGVFVTGGTAPYSYLWSNNNTTDSTYGLCSGNYSVTITDAVGCNITSLAQITCQQQNCTAFFTHTVSMNDVDFNNASSGNSFLTNYYWDFGDNSYYTGANPPTHVYSSSGTYTVCLYMTDSSSSCSDTYCDTVVALGSSSSCSAYFSMLQDSLNPLYWYAFPTVTGQAPFTYLWSFGDNNTSTQAYPTHNYANAGQYTVCLTITDANGCSSMYCDSTSVQRLSQQAALALQMQYLTVVNVAAGVQEHIATGLHAWPNPASSEVTISSDENIDGIVRITGITGNIISEQKMNGQQLRIDVSQLPAGSYNITVNSGTTVWNQRIVILR